MRHHPHQLVPLVQYLACYRPELTFHGSDLVLCNIEKQARIFHGASLPVFYSLSFPWHWVQHGQALSITKELYICHLPGRVVGFEIWSFLEASHCYEFGLQTEAHSIWDGNACPLFS